MASTASPHLVFILTGQSNALGTTCLEGGNSGPDTDEADALTRMWWSNVNAASTSYPPDLYGDSQGEFRPVQPQQGQGQDPTFWGPEFGFVRSLPPSERHRVKIIKVSRGGGGNTYWQREMFQQHADRGHMWGHLCEVTEAALGHLQTIGEPFCIAGLLYLQGESNAADEATHAGVRLAALLDDLKRWLGGKFPGTTTMTRCAVAEVAASQSTAERRETSRQHAAIAAQRSDITFVPTKDLPLKSDDIHFGRAAKLEIGRRFAAVFSPYLTD